MSNLEIRNYQLIKDQDQGNYILIVYLDPQLTEFASEFGNRSRKVKELHVQISELVKKELPHIKITVAKVMVGSMLVTTLYLGEGATIVRAEASTIAGQQATQNDVYTVQPGDSLSVIAKRFNVSVTAIKELNGLTADTIFVGQHLRLPFFTYKVISGDSLSVIAKRFNTTYEAIRTLNLLKSDQIFVGQQLKIPQTPVTKTSEATPTNSEVGVTKYSVVSGDSLSLIAKKFQTSVETIRTLNGLTSDVIFIGQILSVPASEGTETPVNELVENTPTVPELTSESNNEQNSVPKAESLNYTVVSGDSLSLIAKRFNTTVQSIKERNNLTTDVIFIGQILVIPEIQQDQISEPVKTTEITHIVFSGDYLSTIAKRYNVTVEAIKTRNNLLTDTIYIGQKLVIPTQTQVDSQPPSAPLMHPIPTINASNQSKLVVSGTAEANATVTVSLADGVGPAKTFQVRSNADGAFEQTVDVTELSDGPIIVAATATDSAGNRGAEKRITITKDTIAESPTLMNLELVNKTKSSAYPVSGVAEPGARVQIVISDGIHPNLTMETIANEHVNSWLVLT